MSIATTLTTAWKVSRTDGVVEGFTSHDRAIDLPGLTYKPSAGYVPSAMSRSADLQPDSLRVSGVMDAVDLTREDLLAGLYLGARVELLLVEHSVPSIVDTLLVGHFGEVIVEDSAYTIELLLIENELQKSIGDAYDIRCPHILGSPACGFPLSADAGTVATVTTDFRVFTDAGRSEPDDHYTGGKVVFTSGLNSGRTMDIKRYTLSAPEKTIELFEPLPDTIAPDDTFDIYRGCDKRFVTCRDVFDNVNPDPPAHGFGGFPYFPGVSDLLSGQTG